MSISLLFWILYILAVVFSLWTNWPANGPAFRPLGGPLLVFILVGLLGWKVFGAAIRG